MTAPGAPSRLEERYRLVLRLLPAVYREAWEEEMVAAFLESMAADDPEDAEYLADYGRPRWSEVTSVVALAVRLRIPSVRLRFGAVANAPARYVAWGEAVRRVALVGLLVHAVLAAIGLGTLLWLAGRVPFVPPAPVDWTDQTLADRWHIGYTLVASAWVPAYLALLYGYRRAAQRLALVAVAGAALYDVLRVLRDDLPYIATMWANLLFDVVFLVALLAFHPDAPRVRPRPWLVAFAVGVALVTGFLYLLRRPSEALVPLLDWPGMCSAAIVGAALAYLLGVVLRPANRRSPWALAFALLAVAVLALRLVTLPDFPTARLVGIGLIEALAVAAVGVPLVALAARSLRRLSPVPAGAGGGSRG